jgi:enamine deaminase RidA (YjgF/YER057c/UK114 family)
LKALGLVNCAPGFDRTPVVVNGFSDLVLELWGDAGRHARSAIGAAELPFGVPVEVEAVVEVRE